MDKRNETMVSKDDNLPPKRYSGSVFKTWLSIFKKLYKHAGLGDLCKNLPLLQDSVSLNGSLLQSNPEKSGPWNIP